MKFKRLEFSQNPLTFSSRSYKKRGQLGEGVSGIMKVVLVSFIALVVLGLSNFFYDHYIDVRDSEARILAKQVMNCVVPEGKFDLNVLPEEMDIFSYCGFSVMDMERFFVRVWVKNDKGAIVRKYVEGDEGSLWTKKIYDLNLEGDNIKKYEPGYFQNKYIVWVVNETSQFQGDLYVEVVVKDEF